VEALSDHYRIQRELGQGGMATVYLAEDLKHNRKVAIKVLNPELAAALGAERFLREITTTANLRHPHILPLYDSGEAGGFLYYVMPYVEGESLRDRLNREKQLPLDDALRIAREVADAMSYAHRRGVVHRDIKPENILLESGHAVVADFGIARAVDAAGGEQLTQTGLSIGTPTYMSPEQAVGDRNLDGRSDLYSLGCVLYEMLGGQPPFTGPTVESVVHQHVMVDAPPITNLRPAVPPALAAALQRALAKTPADRFNPVALFSDAIQPGVARGPEIPDGAPPPKPRRRVGRAIWITGLAAIVVIAFVFQEFVRRRSRAAEPASLAVLPFADLSPDHSDAYLGDGMAETLTNALAHVPGLTVSERTSAPSRNSRDPAEIGRQLGVATILDGSVQRAGARLRIIARLVRVSDGASIWSERFDRSADSIFALQDEVASAVAKALSGQAPGKGTTVGTGTRDLQAYDAYLQGRFLWNKRAVPDLVQAIGYFNEAIARDSTYARAWAGLADAWLMLPFYSDTIPSSRAIPRARQAAERALSLDPDLAEAHTSLAYGLTVYYWDWQAAEREFRRAIELDPRYPTAHKWYSDLLLVLGRPDDALAEARRAAELDPRDPNPRTIVGLREWSLGRKHEALADVDSALAMDPTFPLALFYAVMLSWSTGDTARFFALRDRLDVVSGNRSVPVSALRAALAAGGRDSVLRVEADAPGARWRGPMDRARWHAQLGDLDAAFADLDQAVKQRSVWMVAIRLPEMVPLHADPRWAALLRRLGLEPMAQPGGGGR
jgi:serine/threonine protein kinase/tetratricopeptide (TPR) repeat protein